MSHRADSSRLLYVEPDPVYRTEVTATCGAEWAVETVTSAEAAIDRLESESVDCIVASDQLPDRDVLEFFHTVQAEDETLPFVLFAAAEDLDLQREAFRAGVTDVVYKQRSPSESTESSASPPTATARDISDGIVGLSNRLATVETASTDLNGTTLDVSRSLMGAADDEVDMKTEWALQSLAEAIDANQCQIYNVDDSDTLSLLHGWHNSEDISADIHYQLFGIGAETVAAERFPGFESQLTQFESACLDVTVLDVSTDGGRNNTDPEPVESADPAEPTEPSESVNWTNLSDDAVETDADAGTLLALPIVIEWQLSGVIVITVDQSREWTEEARQRLQAVGELVGHMERRRRQRAELERQNEQLEQFASVISHDLQNPLNVIAGYLDLAVETGSVEHLDPAVDAADRMEEMLNDLLTLAREGKAVGETTPVDLETVVTGAWESVETYDATLDLVGFEADTTVEADESRLKEAFENLFKNAIVHAGEDVAMRVETDAEMVSVADDGPGIPENERNEVFEHGHTGGNGTGLGLSIVQSIIEGHDWEIEVAESREGGARFDIELDG